MSDNQNRIPSFDEVMGKGSPRVPSFEDIMGSPAVEKKSKVEGGGGVSSPSPSQFQLSDVDDIKAFVTGKPVEEIKAAKEANKKPPAKISTPVLTQVTSQKPSDESITELANKKIQSIADEDLTDPIKGINKLSQANPTNPKDILATEKAKKLLMDKMVADGFDAKEILNRSFFGGTGDDNQTSRILREKAADYDKSVSALRDIPVETDLSQANDEYLDYNYKDRLYSAAVQWKAQTDPNFKKELEVTGVNPADWVNVRNQLGSGKAGNIMAEYLSDPNVRTYLQKENPNLIPAFLKVEKDLLKDNRDFAINQVANKVSKAVQETGYNNIDPIVNYYGEGHKQFADQVAQSTLTPEELEVWNRDIKNNQEQYMDAPSIMERIARGGEHVYSGIGNTFTEPFRSASESTKRRWEKEASHVSADPKGIWKVIYDSAEVLGLVGAISGTGNVLGGGGAGIYSSRIVPALSGGVLPFAGDMLEQGRAKYPDRPITAWTSALFNTAMYTALSQHLFPAKNINQAISRVKPEMDNIVERLANGKISREVARQEANTVFKKGYDFISGSLGKAAKITGELTAIKLFDRGLDRIMMDDETYNKFHNPEKDAGESIGLFLSNIALGGLSKYGEMKKRNRLAEESYYELASNPKKYERMIDNLSIDKSFGTIQEFKANLKYIAEVKKEMDALKINPKEQKRFIFESLKEKAAKEAAEKSTDPTIQKQNKEVAKHSAEVKEKILAGEDADKIITESEQKELDKQQETAIQIERLQKDNELDNKKFDAQRKGLDGRNPDDKLKIEEIEEKRKRANEDYERELSKLKPPTEEENLLKELKSKAGEFEKGESLQYFIDKAGEAPVQYIAKYGDKITNELLSQVPTDKLKKNLDDLLNIDADNPNVKKLDELIEQRESTIASEPLEKPKEGAAENVVPSTLKDVEQTIKKLEELHNSNPDVINKILDDFEGDYSIASLAKEVVDASKVKYTPATNEQIQAIKSAKTPKDVLDLISNTTKDEKLKILANVLKDNLYKAPFLKFRIDFPKDRSGYPAGEDVYGSYGGGKIDVSEKAFWKKTNNYYSSGLDSGYKTVLHEFTHAFTIDAYRKPNNPIEKEFKVYIDKVYSELKNNSAFKEAYGFKSPEEFISEVMTNPEFRRSAAIYKSGILDKIVEFIAKIFGYTKDKNAATDARYKKVNDAFDFILSKIPEIRAGEGKSVSYEKSDSIRRLSEAYHKAKADGSNPKLVKAVEDAMAPKQQTSPPKGDQNISSPINTQTDAISKQVSNEMDVLKQTSDGEGVGKGDTQPQITTPKEEGKGTGEEAGIGEPPLPPPPKGGGVFSERPPTELSHRGLQDVANEFSLPDVKTRDRKSDVQLRQEARETVNDWAEKGQYAKNVEKLVEKAEGGDILTDKERVILEGHLANVSQELRDISDKNSPLWEEKFAEIKRLKEAGQKTRSEAGAALRLPDGGSRPRPITNYADAMVAKAEANGVETLTEKQKSEVEKQVKEYEERTKVAEEKVADLEAKLAEMEATKELKRTTKKKGEKKTAEDYKKERSQYIEELKAAKKEHEDWLKEQGISKMGVGLSLTPKMIKAVSKIIRSYADEIGDNLKEVTKKVYDEVKDFFEGITEKDVHDIIAGVYSDKKTLTELGVIMRNLKDEAALLNKLEALLRGEESKTEKGKIERNQRIKDLRNQIKLIRKGEEVPTDLASILKVKERNEKRAADIQKRIDDKDFSPKEKPKSIFGNEELRKKYPKEYKEMLDAVRKAHDTEVEFEHSLYKDEMAKRSKTKKVIDFGGRLIHTSKAIASGIDDSITFVQLGLAILRNPRAGGKAKLEAIQDISPSRFERKLTELHNKPEWEVMEQSGLDILDPKSRKTEELFEKNLLAKTAFWKYTGGIFERLFTSMGNNMRVNLFLKRMKQLQDNNMTFESHPQEYKDAARVINELTGRGKQNKYVEQASPLVTPIIWSPKLIASGLNLLGISDIAYAATGQKGGFYKSLTPEQRKYALSQVGGGIAMGVAIMAAAAYGGAEVDFDPESITFGNIKFGTTSYNVFGRFTPIIKTIVQFVTGHRKKDGKRQELGEDTKKTRGGLIGGFLRGKMTPFAGAMYDLSQGEQYFNREEFGIEDVPEAVITPLSIKELKNGLEQDGTISILTRFLPSFEGLKVSDERDFEKPSSGSTKQSKPTKSADKKPTKAD